MDRTIVVDPGQNAFAVDIVERIISSRVANTRKEAQAVAKPPPAPTAPKPNAGPRK
jgi:hypothetical protein